MLLGSLGKDSSALVYLVEGVAGGVLKSCSRAGAVYYWQKEGARSQLCGRVNLWFLQYQTLGPETRKSNYCQK